ncbi:MAG: hypothetical protein R2880_05640 [Deinococcales bacterium]
MKILCVSKLVLVAAERGRRWGFKLGVGGFLVEEQELAGRVIEGVGARAPPHHGLLAAMNIYNGLDLKKTLRSAKDEHEAQQEID